MRAYSFGSHNARTSFDSCPEHCGGPRQGVHKQNREIKPKGLDVLEFGGEVALEIVLDDEDAEEVGVPAGASDVPGQGREAERCDCDGVKEAESVAPAFGEERPEENGATGENDGGGAFGEDR